MRPSLPAADVCCACGACVDACPHHALSWSEDVNAFYRIKVDLNRCMLCGLCEKTCHLLNPQALVRHDATQVKPLAGWSTNEEIIRRSASGGAFAQLAHHLLSTREKVYVFGAALMEGFSVSHIEIDAVAYLPLLQNSKYQQSYVVGCYRQVRKRLREGAWVLFSGVPCQIAALYAYLGNEPQERLYTAEVLCHGVPTNELHKKALKFENAQRIVSYRTKEGTGWIGNNNRLTYEMEDGRQVSKKKHVYDFLFRAYLQFSFNRPNCFHCPYATLDRVSDLTLGDFWGWNKSPRKEQYRNQQGVSIILPNSPKGRALVEECKELYTTETTWREILPYNQNLYMPTNDYLFDGASKIHAIRKLPDWLQKFIYQNGFSYRYLNEAYRRLLMVLFWPRHFMRQRVSRKAMNEALTRLEQGPTKES